MTTYPWARNLYDWCADIWYIRGVSYVEKEFWWKRGRPLSAPWVEMHMGEYILQGGSDPGWHHAIPKQCIGRYFSSIRNPYNQRRCINYWSFKRILKTSKIFQFYSLADYRTPVLRSVLQITVCPSVFLSVRQCVFSFFLRDGR